jgi:hypothetical protein
VTVPTESTGSSFPADLQPGAAHLAEAGQRINAELNRRPSSKMVLNVKARERLEILHAEYLADLGNEAVRIARQSNLTTVDEHHVLEAYIRIGRSSPASKIVTPVNTIGGVVAGAGIASVRAVTFNPGPHTQLEILTAVALCVVGFILLTIGITLTFLNKK